MVAVLKYTTEEQRSWAATWVAKVRERLAVSKQTTLKFSMERSILKKLNEMEVKVR
jgi:hypothetical protein